MRAHIYITALVVACLSAGCVASTSGTFTLNNAILPNTTTRWCSFSIANSSFIAGSSLYWWNATTSSLVLLQDLAPSVTACASLQAGNTTYLALALPSGPVAVMSWNSANSSFNPVQTLAEAQSIDAISVAGGPNIIVIANGNSASVYTLQGGSFTLSQSISTVEDASAVRMFVAGPSLWLAVGSASTTVNASSLFFYNGTSFSFGTPILNVTTVANIDFINSTYGAFLAVTSLTGPSPFYIFNATNYQFTQAGQVNADVRGMAFVVSSGAIYVAVAGNSSRVFKWAAGSTTFSNFQSLSPANTIGVTGLSLGASALSGFVFGGLSGSSLLLWQSTKFSLTIAIVSLTIGGVILAAILIGIVIYWGKESRRRVTFTYEALDDTA